MSARDLVFFSPLPPTRNGIADYSASFVGRLTDQFNVYAVVADNATKAPPPGVEMLHISEYMPFARTFDGAGHLYQIGNNADHHYMLAALAQKPGLSTVHDLSLQHLLGTSFPEGVRDAAYTELMAECYGEHGRTLANEVIHFNRQSHVVHTECGFLPAIVRRSAGLVTHSKLGVLRLGACGYERPIHLIDHPCRNECTPLRASRADSRMRARRNLNLPPHSVILLSLGFVTRAKRVDLTLAALAALRGEFPNLRLVIAGAIEDGSIVPAEIARLGLDDIVIMRDYVPDAELVDYLAAADILLNLRYPTLGETSGSLSNGLGVGCCTIVTDVGSYAELPDDCVVKIPVSDMTAAGLARKVLPLLNDPGLRARYEEAAAAHAERYLATDTFVERYVQAIEQVLFPATGVAMGMTSQMVRSYLAPTERLTVERAAGTFAQDRPPLAMTWWRELLLPIGEASNRLLVLGDRFAANLARTVFDWPERIDTIDYDKARDTPPRNVYDVLLAIVNADDFLKDRAEILTRANQLLVQDGILVLNLFGGGLNELDELFTQDYPFASSGNGVVAHHRSAIAKAMETSGFQIETEVRGFSEISSVFPFQYRREHAIRGRKLFGCPPGQSALPLIHY